MKKFYTAVILAGGKSTRMVFDKKYIRISSRSLIEHQIKKLKNEFEEIIVVTNDSYFYVSDSCIVIRDEIKGNGPLSGIHAGLKKATSENVYFLACDMPNTNLDYIHFMKEKIKSRRCDACVTSFGKWIEPFNAFYSKNLIMHIEGYISEGKRSILPFLKEKNCIFIEEKKAREFSPDWNMFLNINTRRDLEMYINKIKSFVTI